MIKERCLTVAAVYSVGVEQHETPVIIYDAHATHTNDVGRHAAVSQCLPCVVYCFYSFDAKETSILEWVKRVTSSLA